MDTKKATPTKVTKKKKTPTKPPGRSSAKSTPTKSPSSAPRGSSDEVDKYYLWLCFMNNGGKTTPDYNVIGAKMGIGYKAAAGRFYKLRKHFESMDKSDAPTKKEEKQNVDSSTNVESDKDKTEDEPMDRSDEEAKEDEAVA